MTMFIALRGSRQVLLATDGFRRSNRQEVMSALAKHFRTASRYPGCAPGLEPGLCLNEIVEEERQDISANWKCLVRVCAVKRRRFPVGASPTRRPLQPEATGAGMVVTKCLKPSDNGSRNTVTARVCRPQRE